MVLRVTEAARRKLMYKVLEKAVTKPTKRRHRRSSSAENGRTAFIDRHQKQKAHLEMMIQERFGYPRARHPRVLTLESEMKSNLTVGRGTPPRISSNSRGEFQIRTIRSNYHNNQTGLSPGVVALSNMVGVFLDDMNDTEMVDVFLDDTGDENNPQFQDSPHQ